MEQSNQRDQDEKRRLLPNIGDTYSATVAGHAATLSGLTTAKIHTRKKGRTRPTSHRKYYDKTTSHGERTKQKSKVSTSPERPTSGPFGDLCHNSCTTTQTDSDNLVHQSGKLDKKTRNEKMMSTSSENLPPWRPAGLAIGKSCPRQLIFDTTKPQMYRRRTACIRGLEPIIPPIKQKTTNKKDRLNSGKLTHTNKHRHQGCLETQDNWKSDFDIKHTRVGSEKELYLHSARKVGKVHPRIARNKLLDSDPDGLLSSFHRSLKTANESSDFKTKGTEGSQENLKDETDVMDDHTDAMCETGQKDASSNSCPCWKSCVKPGPSSNIRWVTFKDYVEHQGALQSDFRQVEQNKTALYGLQNYQGIEEDKSAHDPQANNSNHKSAIVACRAEEHFPSCEVRNDSEIYSSVTRGIIKAERKCDKMETYTASLHGPDVVEPVSCVEARNKEEVNATFESVKPDGVKLAECSAVTLSDSLNVSNLESSHRSEELTANPSSREVDEGIIALDDSNDTTTTTDITAAEASNMSLPDVSMEDGGELSVNLTTTPDEITTPHTAEQHDVCAEEERDSHENLPEYDENGCRPESGNKAINQTETITFVERCLSDTGVDADTSSPCLSQETHPKDDNDTTNCMSPESAKSATSLENPDSVILLTQSHVTGDLTNVSDDRKEFDAEDTKCVDNAIAHTEGVPSESKLDQKMGSADELAQDNHRKRGDEQEDLRHINDSNTSNVEEVSTEVMVSEKSPNAEEHVTKEAMVSEKSPNAEEHVTKEVMVSEKSPNAEEHITKEAMVSKNSSERQESSPSDGQHLPHQDFPIQDNEPVSHFQKSLPEDLTSAFRLGTQESYMIDTQNRESPHHNEDSILYGKEFDRHIVTSSPNRSHVNVNNDTIKQKRAVHFSEKCEEDSNRRPESVAGPVISDVEKNPIPPCWSTFDFTVQRPNTAPEKSGDIGQLYAYMQPENKIPPNLDNQLHPAFQDKSSKATDDASPLMAWPDFSSAFPPETGDTQFDKAFEGINVINLYANLVARYSFRSQNKIREALEQMPPDDNLHRRATMCTPAKKCATEVQKFRQALQDLFMRYFRIEQAQDELCWFVRNMSQTGLQRVNDVINADVSEAQVLQAIEEEVAVAAQFPNLETTSSKPDAEHITHNTDRVNLNEEDTIADGDHDRENDDRRDDTPCDRDILNCGIDVTSDSGQSSILNAMPSTSTLCKVPSITTPLPMTPEINVKSSEVTIDRSISNEYDNIDDK